MKPMNHAIVLLFAIPFFLSFVGWNWELQPSPATPLAGDEVVREHCAIIGLLEVPSSSAIDLQIKCLRVTKDGGMRVQLAAPLRLTKDDKGRFWTPFDVKSYFILDRNDYPSLTYEVKAGEYSTHRCTREDGKYSFKDVIDKLGNDNQ